jgi:aerobic-type carbon monoxide dehydrogenase small subunit (CoxS/CutS family)
VTYPATFTVNSIAYDVEIEADRSLLSVLRDELGLTGTKEGCDDSECGACMVLVNGRPVNSCSYLALQASHCNVVTVEGLAPGPDELAPLQQAFLENDAAQCGFCTPGMLISATALLEVHPHPSEADIRLSLGGNLCRCTGYASIVKAISQVRDAGPEGQAGLAAGKDSASE